MHLSKELADTLRDVVLLGTVILTVGAVAALAWRARRTARRAFAHTVGEVSRAAIVEELAPVKIQVEDLHSRLLAHLTEETGEIARIHQRLDQLGDQSASDAAKVIEAVAPSPSP